MATSSDTAWQGTASGQRYTSARCVMWDGRARDRHAVVVRSTPATTSESRSRASPSGIAVPALSMPEFR